MLTKTNIFYGRKKELSRLHNAWNKATEGKPQAIAITAPSGFGKTRLIQELYAAIVGQSDPDNSYWPEFITESGRRGTVNPDIDFDKNITKASETEDWRPPFIWWGLHAFAPDEKTGRQASCLSDQVHILAQHAIAYEFGLKSREKLKAIKKRLHTEAHQPLSMSP